MTTPKLAIVIHAEEEFDWNGGFRRSKTGVNHADELIDTIDEILSLGGKVTLAMDYPFVTSEHGKQVIDKYKHLHGDSIEFATHLHPWVNPPFENEEEIVSDLFSYPGNLSSEMEYNKLKTLTETIEQISGYRPRTYLAGRYGVGGNTQKILKELGYRVDLSISAYCDFSHQQGPDFSHYTNQPFCDNQITYLPHTSSILSIFPWASRYLNKKPELFTRIQHNRFAKVVGKFLRIKRYRLSPEGFTFKQMKQTIETQFAVGQNEFVLSFHSPSVMHGLTPYTQSKEDVEALMASISQCVCWFVRVQKGEMMLPMHMDTH